MLKAAAWGYHRYADHGAAIDMISLGAGVAQYAIAFASGDNEGLHLLDVLLILQALRVIKLLRIVAPSMHAAVKRMATFALDYIYVFGLLLYVGAIVGNDLFAGRFGPDVASTVPQWARFSHVFSFDSFSASLLCLFEVSLVANWWVVADAAERAHGPVIGRGFFYVYKTVVWLVYLPIFMGFMITAFSKVHAQMKEDHHGMGRQRGVVVELPPGEDEDPDGAGRTFVVQVRTDITNKLFGIDPSVTKLRRQLAQQSSQVEELEAEGEAMAAQLAEQKSTIVRMRALLLQHGLSLDGQSDPLDTSLDAAPSINAPDGVSEWREALPPGSAPAGAVAIPARQGSVLGPRGWRRVALSARTSILRRVHSSEEGAASTSAPGAEGASESVDRSELPPELPRSKSVAREPSEDHRHDHHDHHHEGMQLGTMTEIGAELASLDERSSPSAWRRLGSNRVVQASGIMRQLS